MSEGFVLDKAVILERLGGDAEIFTVLADMYLQEVDGYCQELDGALSAGDGVRLQREAHTAKGLLATFADEAGAQLAYKLEGEARLGGDLQRLAPAVAALNARLREVAGVLRAAI